LPPLPRVGGNETLVVEPTVAWEPGVELNVVATYAAGGITLSVNDSPVVSAAVGALPATYSALTVGNDKAHSKGFSGHVRTINYLPKPP